MWGRKNGTCAAVRLIEGVRLIWGPLNTGLTVICNYAFQEKPRLNRRLSSRKSSLRNSIRRHNSKQRKSREDSIIGTDTEVLEAGGMLSASPYPSGANSGLL